MYLVNKYDECNVDHTIDFRQIVTCRVSCEGTVHCIAAAYLMNIEYETNVLFIHSITTHGFSGKWCCSTLIAMSFQSPLRTSVHKCTICQSTQINVNLASGMLPGPTFSEEHGLSATAYLASRYQETEVNNHQISIGMTFDQPFLHLSALVNLGF